MNIDGIKQTKNLCLCGCGCQTDIITKTQKRLGWIIGEHKKFIQGHSVRIFGRKEHGDCGDYTATSEYNAWKSMRHRCLRKTHPQYDQYGGRGIKVCNEWERSFVSFLGDMGRKPLPSFSLDRIDNEGNYAPGNCRWATPRQQTLNRRNLRGKLSRYRGVTLRGKLKKWVAQITVSGVTTYLGTFPSEKDAAIAYDKAAIMAWGRDARTNLNGKQ